jgi:hypothetical protein
MALVRTVAVAINPVDAKMLDYSPAVGAIHGCDFTGVVVALGSGAPRQFSIGDRVAGAVHGNNSLEPRVGAFAQYVGATAELLLKIPDTMTFEEASTLGIGLATAGLAFFRELEVPVSLALDCVSESDSAQLCYGAIGRAGGRYCGLEPVRQAVAAARPSVRASWLMVLTMFGRRVALDGEYAREASPADRALSANIFAATQTLLDAGRIKSHPVKVLDGRWAGVIQGVDMIRTGAVSGQKLVVRVD